MLSKVERKDKNITIWTNIENLGGIKSFFCRSDFSIVIETFREKYSSTCFIFERILLQEIFLSFTFATFCSPTHNCIKILIT